MKENITTAKTKFDLPLKKNDEGRHSDSSDRPIKISNKFIKYALIIAGSFSTGLGILGIFLPVLPTTPFLLLAAACYAKSSERFFHWLLNNKWLGNYIKNYHEKKGVPLRVKILSIFFLWITISCSAVYVIHVLYGKIILILIAISVSVHIISLRAPRQPKELITND